MKRITKIKEAYYAINKYVGDKFNTSELREEVKSLLEIKLRDYVDNIICDETNNFPEIVEEQKLVARIIYNNKYIDLVFGKDVEIIWEEND